MKLLRKGVGDKWVKPDGYDVRNMTRAVSDEEWKSMDEAFYDLSGGYTLVETTKEDMAKIEKLLNVKSGFFGTTVMIKTTETCCIEDRIQNYVDSKD